MKLELIVLLKIGVLFAAIVGGIAVLLIQETRVPAAPRPPAPTVLRPPTTEERKLLKSMTTVAPKQRRQEMH